MQTLKIESIKYGWFEMRFRNFYIDCSKYLGNDTPKNLLAAVNNLLGKKSEVEWICWDDEPGAIIMSIEMAEDKIENSRRASMKAVVEKIMLVLSGGIWGFISFWWLLFSLGLAFPFSYPGSYDYDLLDQYLIPYGYFGLASYVLIVLIAIIMNRKKPKRIAYFGIPAVLTLIAFLVF